VRKSSIEKVSTAHSCVMLEHVNKVNITFCNVSDHGKLIMFVFM
jgi:hypothetical protein